ncbi:hypothetical protein RDV78_02390 [Bacillota bacterium LX-D]|nr:hypothetical protein [Bacillota bacterium LX-D]
MPEIIHDGTNPTEREEIAELDLPLVAQILGKNPREIQPSKKESWLL